MPLRPGSPAPAFELPSTSGENVSLSSLRGHKVVLYFYPKDSTPGCTVEACDFRDRHGAILASGAVVLGVSKDSLASHDKFRDRFSLPFPLLTDADGAVAKAFGAWGEKSMAGRRFMGTIRTTVVIDGKGRVARVWSPVKVDGHGDEVLAFLAGEEPAKKAGPGKKPSPKKKASSAKPVTRAARRR